MKGEGDIASGLGLIIDVGYCISSGGWFINRSMMLSLKAVNLFLNMLEIMSLVPVGYINVGAIGVLNV